MQNESRDEIKLFKLFVFVFFLLTFFEHTNTKDQWATKYNSNEKLDKFFVLHQKLMTFLKKQYI